MIHLQRRVLYARMSTPASQQYLEWPSLIFLSTYHTHYRTSLVSAQKRAYFASGGCNASKFNPGLNNSLFNLTGIGFP
jgi:hypothetical protein